VVWTQSAQTELEGAGHWLELGPTRRSWWKTYRSNKRREILALQSRKAINMHSIDIIADIWVSGAAAIAPAGSRQS